jgi:ATP-dependent DNA ligase
VAGHGRVEAAKLIGCPAALEKIRDSGIRLLRQLRLAADRASFIEPCLPSGADKPPSGSNWVHEIKHDEFRLMARRDPVGIRPITRRGNDWTQRYPLVAEAVCCLIWRGGVL